MTGVITDETKERSTKWLVVSFEDKDELPAVPASITYRIDCATTGQEVKASTPVTPGSSVEIVITAAENAIINSSNKRETRVVTVNATFGDGGEHHDEYRYIVKNLKGV